MLFDAAQWRAGRRVVTASLRYATDDARIERRDTQHVRSVSDTGKSNNGAAPQGQ